MGPAGSGAGVQGGHAGLGCGGVFGAMLPGIADSTDPDTTERSAGCGQVTRTVRLEDTQGKVRALEVTVSGWKVLLKQSRDGGCAGSIGGRGDLTAGRRVHTVRHGPGQGAWSEGLGTEVVGVVGLTTDDQYGSPEQAHQA